MTTLLSREAEFVPAGREFLGVHLEVSSTVELMYSR
jgi:hypothetical protein